MEPHAIVAVWDGDTLSIDTPSQGLAIAQGRLAGLFGISPDKKLMSPGGRPQAIQKSLIGVTAPRSYSPG